jgi:hypothetical protein
MDGAGEDSTVALYGIMDQVVKMDEKIESNLNSVADAKSPQSISVYLHPTRVSLD